ncbi:MAG: DUF4190 domain-containing protein [Actinomycetales bacterium]|nr:DUF4190 domain-containing protein [Actinomycetales bacterium]
MGLRFNPAPGWPPAPPDFLPDLNWHPDPSWPPAPEGWKLIVDDPYAAPLPVLPPGSYPVPPAPGVDGYAIASLVTALLGAPLIAVILGLVARRRIRESGKGGREMALAGIAIGSALMVLVLGLVAMLAAGDALENLTGGRPSTTATRDGDGVIDRAGSLAVEDLRFGDCFEYPDGAGTRVGKVRAVPCHEPHDAQLYHMTPPWDSYPGESTMQARAEEVCTDDAAMEAIIASTVTESMELTYFYPTAASWRFGSRSVQCVVVERDGTLTRSVLGYGIAEGSAA